MRRVGIQKVTLLVSLAVSVSAIALSACDNNPTPDQLVQRARDDLAAGNPRASIIELKNALQKVPADAAARLLLSEVYLRVGDGASAEKELMQLRGRAEQGAVEPLIFRAWLLQGKFETTLHKGTPQSDDPTVIRAALYGLRARAQLWLGKKEEAEQSLASGEAADPNAADVLAGRAQAALLQKRLDEAKDRIDLAARAAPSDFDIGVLKGDILLATGDAVGSEALLRSMVSTDGNNLRLILGIARAQLAQNELKGAMASLDNVLKVVPQSLPANYLRAVAAFGAKE